MRSDITMIIGTCDKYDIFWENFMILCDKFWEIDCKKIFISETKKVPSEDYDTFLTGKGLPWTDRMLSAVETIDTRYIFQMAEDFYLREPVTEEEISGYVEFLDEEEGNKMLIVPNDNPDTYIFEKEIKSSEFACSKDIRKLSNNSDYQTAVMPSIWRTEWFKEVVKPNWSPWELEINGTNAIKGKDNRVYLSVKDYPGISPGICRAGGFLIEDWDYTHDKYDLKKPGRVESNGRVEVLLSEDEE
tara:strand:- start:453 stop:1187 length:735 start_codon:yes stop_codon:yes gene_type:complete